VRSHVRAADQNAAIEYAERWLENDKWEVVALLDCALADPSGYSAHTALTQGHCFDINLTGISKSFVEEHGIGEDY
jgi:hypothetical protein